LSPMGLRSQLNRAHPPTFFFPPPVLAVIDQSFFTGFPGGPPPVSFFFEIQQAILFGRSLVRFLTPYLPVHRPPGYLKIPSYNRCFFSPSFCLSTCSFIVGRPHNVLKASRVQYLPWPVFTPDLLFVPIRGHPRWLTLEALCVFCWPLFFSMQDLAPFPSAFWKVSFLWTRRRVKTD